ncbi:Protein kinase domain [Trypanosoma melophagium]|uniref:Protein kinase domain n=1 Tax=Trypanosoma melophagium TaxID=715481 RepID=UPI00351A3D04|nr:Protein kinase domain [Trypanosoma melophagium]
MAGDLSIDFTEKYDLIDNDPIGEGAYAVVYKCLNRKTRQEFAVKIVDKGKAGPKDIDSLDFEIRVMEKIGYHPYVVRLIDHFESEKQIYLILDLLNGGMLFNHIVRLSHYSEKSASDLVRNLLSALAHIHSRGIIHRDLKPENLLLRHNDDSSTNGISYLSDVCLADFGLAGTIPSRLCCGSPSYIAPEVINVGYYLTQREPYDEKCDIWSLGVITYILLSGRMPFGAGNYKDTFRRIVSNKWSFSDEIWNSISPVAKAFITACLTQDPKQRPSAKELLKHAWVDSAQPDLHLGESLQELRRFNAQQMLRAAVRVFCTTHSLLGNLDNTPPFMKYLRHHDVLSTVVEVQSQTEASKTHFVDFGKVLNPPPGWRLQDCCTCPSELVCRHIQNVNEYLFVGKRSMDIYPLMDELLLLKVDAERDVKNNPQIAKARENLEKISHVIKAATAFSESLAKIPQDQRKLNLILSVPTNASKGQSERQEDHRTGKKISKSKSPKTIDKIRAGLKTFFDRF